mmetsp:Transcript_37607/g.87940  ORF Transcript_37607/g.87940 Transcript_37607/m.87940 type:complete len:159 (-) Transcript_37607:640-1116(-)
MPWLLPRSCIEVSTAGTLGLRNDCAPPYNSPVQPKLPLVGLSTIIVDVPRHLVVTGIPKVGISSVRELLSERCSPPGKLTRCSEMRTWMRSGMKVTKESLNGLALGDAVRALMLRDPFERLHRDWPSRNEHFMLQAHFAQPQRMQYHFIGILDVPEDM